MKIMIRVWLLTWLLLFGAHPPAAGGEAPEKVLYILCPQEYFSAESLTRFEEATGYRVDVDYVDSQDVIFEMLKSSTAGYDLIVCTSGVTEALFNLGRLLPLDHRRIPAIAGVESRMLSRFPDADMTYQVPYTISIVGLAYDRWQVPPEDRGSWDIYGKKRYAKQGAMLGEMRYAFGAALAYLGHDLNTDVPASINQAKEVLRDWKNNIAIFSFEEALDALNSGDLAFAQTHSGAVAKRLENNPDLVFAVPREGSIIRADCLAIPADSARPDVAHAFINHMLEPVNAAANMNHSYCYLPLPEAKKLLDKKVLDNPVFYIPYETVLRCRPVRNTTDRVYSLYDDAWENVLLTEK